MEWFIAAVLGAIGVALIFAGVNNNGLGVFGLLTGTTPLPYKTISGHGSIAPGTTGYKPNDPRGGGILGSLSGAGISAGHTGLGG